MGSLAELGREPVTLLQTTSSLCEMFVYDTLKGICKAGLESITTVKSKSDFNEMLDMISMSPILAEKWLVVLEYKKVKSSIKDHVGIFRSDTAMFLVKVENYKDYLEFKELYSNVNDLYMAIMRLKDIGYLFKGLPLSSKLINFISKSYAREPDKVFQLWKEMSLGAEITSQKDITAICGVSSGSVQSLVISMLRPLPTTEKGRKTVIRNKLKTCEELIDTYGIESLRNFIVASIKDILAIKMLYMNGVIYNRIKDIPEVYDEKRLSRYSYYLKQIEVEIPYSRIVRFYLLIKKTRVWKNQLQLLDFLYEYYKG